MFFSLSFPPPLPRGSGFHFFPPLPFFFCDKAGSCRIASAQQAIFLFSFFFPPPHDLTMTAPPSAFFRCCVLRSEVKNAERPPFPFSLLSLPPHGGQLTRLLGSLFSSFSRRREGRESDSAFFSSSPDACGAPKRTLIFSIFNEGREREEREIRLLFFSPRAVKRVFFPSRRR